MFLRTFFLRWGETPRPPHRSNNEIILRSTFIPYQHRNTNRKIDIFAIKGMTVNNLYRYNRIGDGNGSETHGPLPLLEFGKTRK